MVRFTAVFFVSALALLAAANPVPSVKYASLYDCQPGNDPDLISPPSPVEDVVDLSTRDILEALETRAVDEMVDDLFERGHLDGELDFDLALRNLEEDLHARMDDLFERGILDGESATDLAERAEFEEGIEARNAKKFFGGLWRKIKGM